MFVGRLLVGHVEQPSRLQRSVAGELRHLRELEEFGDQLAEAAPADRPDQLPRTVWVAALHRAFGTQPVPGPASDREWASERCPEDRVPTNYLHKLLVDRPQRSPWVESSTEPPMCKQKCVCTTVLQASEGKDLQDIVCCT